MSEKAHEKPGIRSRIVPVVLFILAGALIAASIAGYVLQGTIRVVLGDHSERCHKDESFCFRSTAPHKLVNVGKGVCRVLWISSPPSF